MFGFPAIDNLVDTFRYKLLYSVKNILCIAPSLLKKLGPLETVGDIKKFPTITHTLRLPRTHIYLANNQKIPCQPPSLVMNNFDQLNNAGIEGLGMFLTGDCLIEQALASGKLISCLSHLDFRHYEIFMFFRDKGFEHASTRGLVDFFSN